MTLKISAGSLFTNHHLIVRSDGIQYCETAGLGSGRRRFRFTDIVCVLMSPDNKLSFQVGEEVFSIPTNPANPKHQSVIAALVQEVRRAGEGWTQNR